MGSRRGRVCVLRRAQRRRQAYLARFEPFPRRPVPRLLASKRGRKAPLPFPTRRALAPRRTAFSRPSLGAPREPWGFPSQGFPDLPSPGQGIDPLEPAAAVVAEPFTVPDSQSSPTAPRCFLARPACAGSPSGAGLLGSAARRGRQGRAEPAKTFPPTALAGLRRKTQALRVSQVSRFSPLTLRAVPLLGQASQAKRSEGARKGRLAALSSVRWRELIVHRGRKTS